MTIREVVDQYIAWQRAHGAKFRSSGEILQLFLKSIDGDITCNEVTTAQICDFLAGDGRLTRYRENKYSAFNGFFRYAISRGYTSRSPLPDNEPKAPPSAPPYVYSTDELRRLFDAIDVNRKRGFKLDARTFRIMLLLLYGAGLRLGEALRLTMVDVDLVDSVLTVRDTKFYKGRLVPTGPQLTHALCAYADCRAMRAFPKGEDSSFLAILDGNPLSEGTARSAFNKLRRTVGITRTENATQSPCLHSFRHSFAVHRLTSWYRQGADVQRLLPALSTYLGHKNLVGTQVYLSMTPELLQEASLRFERFARGENDE